MTDPTPAVTPAVEALAKEIARRTNFGSTGYGHLSEVTEAYNVFAERLAGPIRAEAALKLAREFECNQTDTFQVYGDLCIRVSDVIEILHEFAAKQTDA